MKLRFQRCVPASSCRSESEVLFSKSSHRLLMIRLYLAKYFYFRLQVKGTAAPTLGKLGVTTG